ncbi:very-long-chain (3R)-3-hydroxyacyl-CoA dehydratase isoform X2 [Corythoichthys intestinalis]|uniref:very-long-chain (3R)-3-hydroxyacyl-CoA dehydratase isoform X2 n=1 Tax=Corythoichthys intestinalis TaxID=161448 RepID=UPI0025A64922|nr:very-long-chain (3R)-3-hydroxyacyl-CoA dehydratase isoform X2 [Corythoichthys intestinalis]XP_061812868.1 very-long-chain (3R)-3-hydroxyacyl-CoA dehydratase-like [Nerophis lumbriciformis]
MALTPLVYWAQRHEEIYLRVELTDAQNIKVHVDDNVLHFQAQGHGAKGQNLYEFNLEFLSPVKTQVAHKSTQRQVNITVKKGQRGWWERLTKLERKPLFLAPDFDRWLDESDAELEIRQKEEKKNRQKASQHDEEGFISLKTVFLFTYNLVQFLGYSWIFVNMTIRLLTFGQDSFYDTFHTISGVMFFCQIFAAIEVLNAAFGVVRTGVIPTVIQLFGRNFILFIIFGCLEEMQNKPVVFFVFYPWSAIEIFRYPFYMLECFNTEWKLLTWLRYSLWIPLYPLGALAEAVAVIQSIPIFDESNLFSIPLPKAIGTSVKFSYVLRVHLALLFLGLFINFRHLYKQRQRRLRTKKRKAQ